MNDALRVTDYLQHIRDAIERIFRYVEALDEVQFKRSDLVQDAVVRNLEIIGEASRNIERVEPEFLKQHRDIEFANARAMRNMLAHGYYKVDLDVVWDTIQQNLGALHQKVTQVLSERMRDEHSR